MGRPTELRERGAKAERAAVAEHPYAPHRLLVRLWQGERSEQQLCAGTGSRRLGKIRSAVRLSPARLVWHMASLEHRLVLPPVSSKRKQSWLSRSMSRRLWNASKDGESAASLDTLFLLLITHRKK